VPILDVDVISTDTSPAGDVHMKYNHFVTRQRLINANGHADNMVMWSGVFGPRVGVLTQAFLQMAAWLDNITADTSDDPLPVKVVRNKPVDLTDGCWTGTTAPFTFIAEPQFPRRPRHVGLQRPLRGISVPARPGRHAVSDDIVACHLRKSRLQGHVHRRGAGAAPPDLPQGVCDFTRPGIAQRVPLSTWITYIGVGRFKADHEDDGGHEDHDEDD
jgi:hypothetical protein